MDPQIPLTKKERKELKRQEKLEAKDAVVQSRQTKKIIRWIGWTAFGVATIAGLVWLVASRPPVPESDIVSRSAFHWHPELTIYVKGEKQEIPENIGIGAVHQPIHTHDDSGQGVVHMEFQGLARKQDTTLGQFFRNWGKDINSFGTLTKMTVNGVENVELDNYVMRDKDKIEIWYE
ncbi:MAG: hypothetical protein UU11_C0002G0016 [Parcubacteria group bacterium GW2011_GWF2_40_69]|nr:MAG: hypothetical protein UT49_C0002G0071 [Parcubacteria group bacterium GW2011_GWF1_39_37]KKR34647.1 MAG: hypothetical protein UT68_C0011G0005 [Parcubacteria group bacterium GW2011_GWC2_40_10]KKR52088.1 MAG: hypothetical protein UT89_C0003G0024 [Parcubacteria group bacterium GW2011_GWE1_40_20]KKR69218.1 MAG: hypothetical protein UU11_C0002G0016 [Parcubacteria group bacterium GW2011_GWF2_40_69]KKS35622.1 MAG: hypothetical protein UU99_C0006G0026 [Parcubacteria group bacterium GW2011_GWE2_42_